jgi:hypothetical protein
MPTGITPDFQLCAAAFAKSITGVIKPATLRTLHRLALGNLKSLKAARVSASGQHHNSACPANLWRLPLIEE